MSARASQTRAVQARLMNRKYEKGVGPQPIDQFGRHAGQSRGIRPELGSDQGRRQRQKNDAGLFRELLGVRLGEAERAGFGMTGKTRKDLRHGLTRILSRGDRREFDVRMIEQESDEFFAGISGGSYDGDFLHAV